MASSTVEDYVKHIYLLSDELGNSSVPMGKVATALGVVPGTATTMVKALSDARLVVYAPRVGVELTEEGRTLALHVLRRHRLIEQFLVEVLGFDWSEVHAEAERLEHVVSELLLERIDALLGRPKEDPHGDPIPDAEGSISPNTSRSLAACREDENVTVRRIRDQDSSFLQYLAEKSLGPGTSLKVINRSLSAEAIELELLGSGTRVTLGLGAAAKLDVGSANETEV